MSDKCRHDVRDAIDILIVGTGLAGLSAAVALAGTGARVALLESKPYVGGRAYSYEHPVLEEVIDSQHVLLGCCTNLIDLCRLAGADRHIRWYDRISFLEPNSLPSTRPARPARRSEIGTSFLPAPGHSAFSFLRAPMLSLADKSRIAIGLLDFLHGRPASDEEAFSTWLERTRQTERAKRHFWEPVIVSTLNDSFDRCSTSYAAQVIHESFLKSPEGGRLGIPTQPLSEFYTAVAQLAEQEGTALHLRTSVASIARVEDAGRRLWQATISDGCVLRASNLLLALPFEQTSRLLATLPKNSTQQQLLQDSLAQFTHAPITTIHLWFDRAITELDHAALLDTRVQWMFNKTRIRRDESTAKPTGAMKTGQYIELVISASFAELAKSRAEILSSALAELERFFPAVRQAQVLKSGVLKEARATFSVVPGLDRFRPAPDALGDGLYLAGDWTQTGWPSTMEGAVRSGRLAAEAIARAGGAPRDFLAPDLPASGIMRWLGR
jgi:squalene-associated FAD-dependent desaturase